MKQNSAIVVSMLLLALILAGAQIHALVTLSAHNKLSSMSGLKASVIETIEHLNDRRSSESPAVPGLRGVPGSAIN
jgi:hypothetical protein